MSNVFDAQSAKYEIHSIVHKSSSFLFLRDFSSVVEDIDKAEKKAIKISLRNKG